jgi:glycosyltransferase involved in cell wall biosynthesis
MAELYNAADAYACPYMAEGFNLPALEAAACGVPVICTKGGPTDEFLGEDSALFIASDVGETTFESAISETPQRGVRLMPDADHLAKLMDRVVSDDAIGDRARRGASGLAERTTWPHSLDRLMTVVFD